MRWLISLGLVLATGLVAMGGLVQETTALLREAYPEVRFYTDAGQVQVYGTELGFGLSPEHTADSFIQSYSGVFGVSADELLPGTALNDMYTQGLMYDPQTDSYACTLVCYRQYKDGIPVDKADLRLLIGNRPGYPLVLANSTLVDLEDFTVPPDATANIAEGDAHAAAIAQVPGLINFSESELIIWPDLNNKPRQPRVAIAFVADNGMPATGQYEKWRFVADARTGEILERENLILSTDVTGTVRGMGTTIPKADICNPEIDMAMPYAKVAIGSTTAYADANGNFTIPNSGSSPVTVYSYMSGTYFTVSDQGGPLETLNMTVTPPGPANFMHNAANTSEFIRAQVNGYIQANVVRDFVLAQNPTYPTIYNQTNFPVNVNINSTCNAYYDYSSINFYRAGGGCSNTAFSSVIHHEYGHHVVSCGGSGQDAYGEGMADCMSVLIADDPVLAYGFYSSDCNNGIRNADNNLQYPCSGEIHYCGQLLSGCVWSTRNQLLQTNPLTYRSIISKLTVNSVLLHGSGGSITPAIYNHFIQLDDQYYDGSHHNEITAGFAAHNMVPQPPPANDNCANAIVACPGQVYTGNTASATVDGSTSCGSSNSTPDVWYKYTPASSGTATFSLCSGTSYDSVMSIHSGCPGTSGNTLNCDDDGCGGYSAPSTITRSVTAGTTYYIRISGWSGATGSFSLQITGPACQQTNYTLTVNIQGQGAVTLDPPGGTYPSGTVVTLTANGASGWHFDHWSGDLTGSANPTTIVMNSNKTVTAWFVRDQYTLTVNTVGSGSVTLDPPGGIYPSGTIVTLHAIGNPGWCFDHWEGDLTGKVNPTTILMSGNRTVTAVFALDCNGNGVPDYQDIGSGGSYDDNENGVPDECEKLAGDLNCDGVVSFADINPFILLITDLEDYLAQFPNCVRINGDINGDGVVNFADINPFVNLIGRR